MSNIRDNVSRSYVQADYTNRDAVIGIIKEYIEEYEKVQIGIRLFREGATMPTRATDFSSGWDIYAFVNEEMSDWTHWLERGYPSYAFGATTPDQITSVKSQITIGPGETRNIKTGINFRIPEGYDVQIRPRSGLAHKNQITVINAPGTIDSDYDGDGEQFELNMMLVNHGKNFVVISHGMRVGQMVVSRMPKVTLVEVFGDNPDRLESNRNGGLGSTGKH